MLAKSVKDLIEMYGRLGPIPSGEYGIEVEVEGRNLPIPPLDFWAIHDDHSLRGEACEYVLKSPLDLPKLPKALSELSSRLKDSIVHKSNRTSVHVHRNVSSWKLQEVYTLIALYFIFEEFLVRFSGEDRQGNMYCLRCSDAEYLILQIVRHIAEESHLPVMLGDNIRYSSLNLKPLLTFGSMEFRSFRGSVDPAEILEWVFILDALIKGSKKFKSPLDLVLSYQDMQEGLADYIFQDTAFLPYLKRQPDLITGMRHGYSYAFEVAYAPRTHRGGWIDLSKVPVEEAPKKKGKRVSLEEAAGQLIMQNNLGIGAVDVLAQPRGVWNFAQPVQQPPMPMEWHIDEDELR